MKANRVIIVHLRQPVKHRKDESRADPFYEFGSFGCTGCHRTNLMNPKKLHELNGARLAFAQGGPLGFRLVHLTPPIETKFHGRRGEALWSPAVMPFRYEHAPLLVNAEGNTAFPKLKEWIRSTLRKTWPAKFSSRFRSCRTDLPNVIADEMIRVFKTSRAKAKPAAIAQNYTDALPYLPNNPITDRAAALALTRAEAARKKPVARKAKTPTKSRRPDRKRC